MFSYLFVDTEVVTQHAQGDKNDDNLEQEELDDDQLNEQDAEALNEFEKFDDDNDEYCEGWLGEMDSWIRIFEFSRE